MKVKGLLYALAVSLFAMPAMAQDGGAQYTALAACLGIAIAAFGGAIAQGRAAAAALEGIARNPAAQPKLFVPMIIGLALIESLVIYALVVVFVKA